MASAASRCSEKAPMASAPKKSTKLQNSPIRPNIYTLSLYTRLISRGRPFSLATATSREMATGSPAVESMKSIAYMEYAALKMPMFTPSMYVMGILKSTPMIFTIKFDNEIIRASVTKLLDSVTKLLDSVTKLLDSVTEPFDPVTKPLIGNEAF